MEDQLSEKAEENLCGAASRGPADPEQRDAEDQRRGAHVAESFDVFVPGAGDIALGEGFALRAKITFFHMEARNGEGRENERKRVQDESRLEAHLRDGRSGGERAD